MKSIYSKKCFLLCILFVCICQAALPPGYQDEIYCPPIYCLKPLKRVLGWSGPQLSFKECCNILDGSIIRPKAWGFKIDPAIKYNLIQMGWHSTYCSEQQHAACSASTINTTASKFFSNKIWAYKNNQNSYFWV